MVLKKIIKESRGELKPITKIHNLYLVYNLKHHKEEIMCFCRLYKEAITKIQKNWKIYPGAREWIFKAPEATVCDLTEPWENVTKNPTEILTFYRILKNKSVANKILKKLNSKYLKLEIRFLKGKSLEAEIRIVGSDQRIFKMPKEIFILAKKTKGWGKEFKRTQKQFTKKIRPLNIKFVKNVYANRISKRFIEKISRRYNLIFEHKNLRIIDRPIKYNKVLVGIWKKIPKCDIKSFILWSGFKFALGYFYELKKDDVFLLELHTGMDIFKTLILSKRKFKNKRIAVIDKSYCGETIRKAEEIIKQSGGKPFGIALWPKSRMGLRGTSYFFVGDKLYKTKKNMLKQKNLFENLFIEVFK